MVRDKRPRANKSAPVKKSLTDRKSRRTPATGKDKHTDSESGQETAGSFPVVGIGASAGGLEAFTLLLQHLPADTGMGFVLVQHLDPVHESALTKLLSRASSMPVRDVTNNLRVEANNVYVIPPNTTLSIAGGVLKLQPRQKKRTPPRSIDSFLESLAQDQHERAIGVILSGTASDGTLGLEAIKAEGGITFAQDDSARYDSMPRSAVAAGCVDLVLSPAEIAQELARIAKHPYLVGKSFHSELEREADQHGGAQAALASGGHGRPRTGSAQARAEAKEAPDKKIANGYKTILLLLRNHCGVDFSLYKSPTIRRRLTRRVILNKQSTLDDYADFLRGNAKELDALYSDVLISVTSFFRNPEGFEFLKRKVFPKLLQQGGDDPFRVWVLGCSTGQEAYSLAMTFMEAAEKAPRLRKLQVFATDLNDALLEKARHGLYTKSLAEDVSPERLRRFFVEEEGGYRVVKSLREMVVFARQNLISDPPFSRMNLISCRNLLIYLEPSLQKKALPTFHYALKPGGFLFLGASESIGNFSDLFEPVDKKHKIYSKKAAPNPAFHLPVKKERSEQLSPGGKQPRPLPWAGIDRETPEGFRAELNAQREADRVTVNQFAPPGVLINAELQILQFRGPTSAYLQPPTSGKASFNVLKMAREGLMLPLRSAINKAKKENTKVRRENIRVDQNGNARTVNIEVIPLKNLPERSFLILFEEAQQSGRDVDTLSGHEPSHPTGSPQRKTKREEAQRSAEQERELSETRDYLQSIQEQYEAANEELQASSEEVQSANEELQSINEELETSKEELESTNEELTTVNEEMASRNTELNRLNSDLLNLQTSTKLAIVLLGRDLTIRRFSAQAEKQFNLLVTDVGRPIGNVRHNLDFPDLEDFIAEVITSVREREREVQDKEDRWFSLRVRPYMTLDHKIDGAVLVLVDVTDLKRTEQQIRDERNYAQAIIRTVPHPLLVLDDNLRIETANESFYQTFQVAPEETEGRLIYELGDGQWDIPALRELLEEILPQKTVVTGFEVTHTFETIGLHTMLLNASRLESKDRGAERILLSIENITERRLAEMRIAADLDAMTRLHQVGGQCALPGAEYDRCIAEVLAVAIGLTGAIKGNIQLLDNATGTLTIAAYHAFEEPFLKFFQSVSAGEAAACGAAISLGERVVVEDVTQSEIFAGQPSLDVLLKAGVRAVQSTPLISSAGNVLGMISTHFATPRHFSDRELRLVDLLARQASDYIERKLAEEELNEVIHKEQEARAQSEAANRVKDEFLAMVSHELRTPLNAIVGWTHLLKSGKLGPSESERAVQTIDRNATAQAAIISELLDVSSIVSGKLKLDMQPVDLSDVISEAVDAIRPAADAKGIEVVKSFNQKAGLVSGEAVRLQQVFWNLLTNAVKFTPQQGRVEVQLVPAGKNVEVVVTDTGAGIPSNFLPHIFERFQQADTSEKRLHGGLGLGLSIVRNLVEMHGGSVSAASEGEGRGATFRVLIPLLVASVAAASGDERSEHSVYGSAKPEDSDQRAVDLKPDILKGLRVLAVDDQPDTRDLIFLALTRYGAEVNACTSATEASEVLKKWKPEVIVSDIGMPGEDGYALMRRIRALAPKNGGNIPAVALTGYAADVDASKAYAAGYQVHLTKPVALRELVATIAKLAGRLDNTADIAATPR